MLAGTDIVGDTILEVNVFSPGNLFSCSEMAGVNFAAKIRESIELLHVMAKRKRGE